MVIPLNVNPHVNWPVIGVLEPETISISDAKKLLEDDGRKERADAVRRRFEKTCWIRVDVIQTVIIYCT